MKKKNSLLGTLLVVAVLVLGVGYAVINETNLVIGGTAEAKTEAIKVSLLSCEDTPSTGSAATVEHTYKAGDTKDTFTISNLLKGESVVLLYTVQNEEVDIDAVLSEVGAITNKNTDYFDATYELLATEVAKNSSVAAIKVTVTLKETPVTVEQSSTEIGLTVKATAKNS